MLNTVFSNFALIFVVLDIVGQIFKNERSVGKYENCILCFFFF